MGWGAEFLPYYYGLMRIKHLIATTFIALISSFAFATSSTAHTDVVSTSPADGAVIDVTPADVSITFSEPPIQEGAAILLADVSGVELPLGEVEFNGAQVKAAAPTDLPAGDYIVTWRVSAQDGHVLTGEFSFTFTGKVAVANPTNTVTAGTQETAVAVPVMDDAKTGNSGSTLLTSLIAVLVVSAIVAAVIASKKRN